MDIFSFFFSFSFSFYTPPTWGTAKMTCPDNMGSLIMWSCLSKLLGENSLQHSKHWHQHWHAVILATENTLTWPGNLVPTIRSTVVAQCCRQRSQRSCQPSQPRLQRHLFGDRDCGLWCHASWPDPQVTWHCTGPCALIGCEFEAATAVVDWLNLLNANANEYSLDLLTIWAEKRTVGRYCFFLYVGFFRSC